jgi:16S rRNA processing protein RimM
VSKLVSIGYVARAHGLKGELRVHPHNETTDTLRRRAKVVLRVAGKPDRDVVIEGLRPVPGAFLITLPGVGDRSAAEALRGAEILVPREELPPVEEGEFYAVDIEGARVELTDGSHVGAVIELRDYPSVSALAVTRLDGTEIEVPLVEAYVSRIDTAAKLVVLHHVDDL